MVAIQGILNKNNTPVPAQVNYDLLPKINENMEAILREVNEDTEYRKNNSVFVPEIKAPDKPKKKRKPKGSGVWTDDSRRSSFNAPIEVDLPRNIYVTDIQNQPGMDVPDKSRSMFNKITDSLKRTLTLLLYME